MLSLPHFLEDTCPRDSNKVAVLQKQRDTFNSNGVSRGRDWCLSLLNAVWVDVIQSAGVQWTEVGPSHKVQLWGAKAVVDSTQELCHNKCTLKESNPSKNKWMWALRKHLSTHLFVSRGKPSLILLLSFTFSASHSPSSEFINAAKVSEVEMFHLPISAVEATREIDPSSWTCWSDRPDGYAYKKRKEETYR